MTDSEITAALRRAGRRAAFHLLKAAVEGLRAVEVVVDELANMGRQPGDDDGDERSERVHIDVE